MPNYIHGLSDFAPPPYVFTNLRSATFVIKGDPNKLALICEKYLNGPLNRTAAGDIFVPAGSQRVLVCCSTFPDVQAPVAAFGYSAYTEVTLLFSVFDRRHQEWSWYAPVLYLDGPPADVEEWQAELPIAVGREMYGLPKTRGHIALETTYFTGTMEQVDTNGTKIDLSDSIGIDLGECAMPTIDDEIAVEETAALGVVIAEYEARIKQLPHRKITALRRRISMLRRRIAKLRKERDRIAKERHAAMFDLIHLRDNPGSRELLTPKDLMEMFWGGDPYERLDIPRPDDWLANLGFIRRDSSRRALMLTGSDFPESTVPEPGDYELEFWLLGLRQLHDPDPANFGQAVRQEVVRTKLRFDQLPFKPGHFYCIDIKDSLMAQALGIGPTKQTILPINNYAYSGATAWFGELAKIVT
jgi:hypothetical protein